MEQNSTAETSSTESKKRPLLEGAVDAADSIEKEVESKESLESKRLKSDDQSDQSEDTVKVERRRRAQKPEPSGPMVNKPEYYFENGLRKVRPYWFRFVTTTKGRWVGRRLGEVFETELYAKDPSFFVEQAKLGRVTVNDQPTSLDYVLKDNDIVRNIAHRHEMPVLHRPIDIVLDTEDVLVVNKPCSLPSHQCGRYYFNSLTYMLQHQYGIEGLKVTHRLDRLTSGLIIFAKTLSKARELFFDISERNVRKHYLARVVGEFPDQEMVCDQPIGPLSLKMGIHWVASDGKSALTRFQKLFTDGQESVVRCIPETGRTHQIRVHLQYLGYPIVNDNIYNNFVFGPEKGKGGVLGKPKEQLVADLITAFGGAAWIDDFDSSLAAYVEKRPESSIDAPSAKPDLTSPYYDAHCIDCHVASRDPPVAQLEMYLHCLKYEGPDWSYSTPMPNWAIPPGETS